MQELDSYLNLVQERVVLMKSCRYVGKRRQIGMYILCVVLSVSVQLRVVE